MQNSQLDDFIIKGMLNIKDQYKQSILEVHDIESHLNISAQDSDVVFS